MVQDHYGILRLEYEVKYLLLHGLHLFHLYRTVVLEEIVNNGVKFVIDWASTIIYELFKVSLLNGTLDMLEEGLIYVFNLTVETSTLNISLP